MTNKPLWVVPSRTEERWQIIHVNKVSPVGRANVDQLDTRADSCVNKTPRAVFLVGKDVDTETKFRMAGVLKPRIIT